MALSSSSSSPSAPFPAAAAADIIRSHQKDAYFTGHLANTLSDIYRRILGARSAHAAGLELRSLAALLYYALTTLPGNRTLGEEYCDLVHVDRRGRLPALRRRAAYLLGAVILPYALAKGLPPLRSRLRRLLERRLQTLAARDGSPAASTREARLCGYLATHLASWTSPASVNALSLALFYFNGTYYELSKRLLSLRYVFTRAVPDSPDRAGYEVLGILLAAQLVVQACLHVRAVFAAPPPVSSTTSMALSSSSSAASSLLLDSDPRLAAAQVPPPASALDVSLDHDNSYATNNLLLASGLTSVEAPVGTVDVAATTHTPVLVGPRFQLADAGVMAYIQGSQQRKCTLCLDPLKDPAATPCGHVFCWACIADWVREKPECPLCRREATAPHILPLRTA